MGSLVICSCKLINMQIILLTSHVHKFRCGLVFSQDQIGRIQSLVNSVLRFFDGIFFTMSATSENCISLALLCFTITLNNFSRDEKCVKKIHRNLQENFLYPGTFLSKYLWSYLQLPTLKDIHQIRLLLSELLKLTSSITVL